MAFYENRHEHFGGALVLFQRNLAVAVPNSKRHRKANWYMRLKIGGRAGYVTRSTKLTSYEDAYEYAKAELLRLQQAARLGHSFKEYTFAQQWDDWYARLLNNGTWKEDRARWHMMYANRYFKPYFKSADGSSMLLNEITPQVAKGYWDWRIAYWKTGAGERLTQFNPKRRNAKSQGTANAKKAPSVKTLQMEQSALNQIFYDAAELGRLQQVLKLRAPSNGGGPNRRAGIASGKEYQSLIRNLRSYRDCTGPFKDQRPNVWHKQQRVQMYHFVLFMLNSGLRVGEARQMRWSDIKFNIAVEGQLEPICEVAVRKATKTGKARHVQTQPSANKTLLEWMALTPHAKPSDHVWFGQAKDANGKPLPFTDLNKSFQQFLAKVEFEGREGGLLYDANGDKRSLYSLRHTYATLRLEKGDVNVYDLSLNMGCKVNQIENHYSHVLSKQRRHAITKFSSKPIAQVAAKTFEQQALEQFQAGKIDQATFLGIVQPKQ